MASALVQFRTDAVSRDRASQICEKLGIDLQTYMRMCIFRLIQENGIPFSMKVQEPSANRGLDAMREASRIASEYGISDLTLDEINAEIADSRK